MKTFAGPDRSPTMRRVAVDVQIRHAITLTQLAKSDRRTMNDLCGLALDLLGEEVARYWTRFEAVMADQTEVHDWTALAMDADDAYCLGSKLAIAFGPKMLRLQELIARRYQIKFAKRIFDSGGN
jgi:hypothetical protein